MAVQFWGVHSHALVGDPPNEASNQSNILAIIRDKFEDFSMLGQRQKTIRQKCFCLLPIPPFFLDCFNAEVHDRRIDGTRIMHTTNVLSAGPARLMPLVVE